MPPTLKKVRGHIASGLSVHSFVHLLHSFIRSFVMLSCAWHNFRPMYADVLKFHIWIPREKIGDPYFFSYPNYLPFESYFPFNKITLKSR